MKDLGQLKILLSGIFCFVGSCTLLVSFSVCGHNLFKDMASRTSLMLAGFIGFWLFVLSPVSFVILFPDLFIYSNLINDPTRIGDLVQAIHILLQRCIVPFILSAVGLGIMIGALSEIKPRKTLLQYINKSLGLNLRQFSYDMAWDSFLRGIKNHGILTIILENKIIRGQLVTFSVISEPKQIILQDCTVTDIEPSGYSYPEHHSDHLLVTEFAHIREIRADSNSLKKHYHELNHCAQTTYYIMSGIGALCLVNSLHSSSQFLSIKFNYVTYFYDAASFSFLVLSIIFLGFAIRALRHDFSSYRAAIIFYPVLTILIAAFILAVVYSAINTGASPSNSSYLIGSIFPSVITLTTIFVSYSIWFNRKIHRSLQGIIKQLQDGSKLYRYSDLQGIMAKVYLAVDFNSRLPLQDDSVLKHMEQKDNEFVNKLIQTAAEVFEKNSVLSLEQANIIMKWHHILRSGLPLKQRWWWPSEDADPVQRYCSSA